MNKIIFIACTLAILGSGFLAQAQNGFVVWSKGGGCERELHYNEITDGNNVGPAKVAIKKGPGADIWPHISYDGEWIAWCRSPEKFEGRYGACDYHNFGIWDIYVARIDFGNSIPVEKVIKIANGYFPSWAMNENAKTPGAPKTLYFTKYDDQTIQKTTINPDGTFSPPVEHSRCPIKMTGTNAHTQGSPDGKFILYRPAKIKLYSVELKKDIGGSLGGCHPCWGPRSKYFIRSTNGAFFNTGTSVKNLGKAGVGAYFQGISNDAYWDEGRLWVIGAINNYMSMTSGFVEFRTVEISNDGKWVLGPSTKVGRGDACDIHMFLRNFDPHATNTIHGNVNVSKNILPFTFQLLNTASGLQLVIKSNDLTGRTAALFDMHGIQLYSAKMGNDTKTIMPLKGIVNGGYILKVSNGNVHTLKSILILK